MILLIYLFKSYLKKSVDVGTEDCIQDINKKQNKIQECEKNDREREANKISIGIHF
jgi:hypothetical protein